jgi:hypothetical protein
LGWPTGLAGQGGVGAIRQLSGFFGEITPETGSFVENFTRAVNLSKKLTF